MAAVLPRMQSATSMKNSVKLSLLDQSWHSQPIQIAVNPNYSMAVCVPSEDSGTTTRSSGPDSGSEMVFFTKYEVVNDDHHIHGERNNKNSGNEKINRCYCADQLELRRVFDRFDKNADGLICGEELRQYMRCCYGDDLSDEEAKSIISCVDLNKDGAVDFEEFLSLYKQQSHNCSGNNAAVQDQDEEQDLLEAFRVFDINKDGFISAHELQAVLLNLGMPEGKSLISCEKMIRHVDRNGDGQCDIREFQELMSSRCSV